VSEYRDAVPVPHTDIDRVERAHVRFVEAIATLDDQDVRRASLLPGWTVAHVLTHVARNADSHVRRAEAARSGEVVDQYVGGAEGRSAEIEAGASRSAADVIADVRRSAEAVEATWRELPAPAWAGRSRDTRGGERPLFELPARRWQELEVHLVDLDIGVSHRSWSDDFVLEWLPRTRERLWKQVPGLADGATFEHAADELAWFYGRLHRPDLTELPPWD